MGIQMLLCRFRSHKMIKTCLPDWQLYKQSGSLDHPGFMFFIEVIPRGVLTTSAPCITWQVVTGLLNSTSSNRDDSRLALSQWETSLQSNAASHWPGTNLESTPYKKCDTTRSRSNHNGVLNVPSNWNIIQITWTCLRANPIYQIPWVLLYWQRKEPWHVYNGFRLLDPYEGNPPSPVDSPHKGKKYWDNWCFLWYCSSTRD